MIGDRESPAWQLRKTYVNTVLLFKGGQVVDQRVGAMPKPELVKMVTPHLASAVAASPVVVTASPAKDPVADALKPEPAQKVSL